MLDRSLYFDDLERSLSMLERSLHFDDPEHPLSTLDRSLHFDDEVKDDEIFVSKYSNSTQTHIK